MKGVLPGKKNRRRANSSGAPVVCGPEVPAWKAARDALLAHGCTVGVQRCSDFEDLWEIRYSDDSVLTVGAAPEDADVVLARADQLREFLGASGADVYDVDIEEVVPGESLGISGFTPPKEEPPATASPNSPPASPSTGSEPPPLPTATIATPAKQKAKSRFSLVTVTISIGVAMLLASIAVPAITRARTRSQAAQILLELRLLDAAKDQYAIESNKKSGDPVRPADIAAYLRPNTRLGGAVAVGDPIKDIFGNPVTLGVIDQPPTLSAETLERLDGSVPSDFFGEYSGISNPVDLAWNSAVSKNTLKAFERFRAAYPKSSYDRQALDKVEDLTWRTLDGKEYLRKFPNGKHAREALERLETAEWQAATAANSESLFRDYLSKYPNGRFSALARTKIEPVKGEDADELAWKAVGDVPSRAKEYLRKFPSGRHAREASDKIETAEWEAAASADYEPLYRDYLSKYPNGRYAAQARSKTAAANKTEGRDKTKTDNSPPRTPPISGPSATPSNRNLSTATPSTRKRAADVAESPLQDSSAVVRSQTEIADSSPSAVAIRKLALNPTDPGLVSAFGEALKTTPEGETKTRRQRILALGLALSNQVTREQIAYHQGLRSFLQPFFRDCASCNGTGFLKSKCATCKGQGNLRCSFCYGTGRVTNRLGSTQCVRCEGTGHVKCSVCNGTGSIQTRCPVCDGNKVRIDQNQASQAYREALQDEVARISGR